MVIRNTAITAWETVSNNSEIDGRTRVERKVLPTPVTCIAFHHKHGPVEPSSERARPHDSKVEKQTTREGDSRKGYPQTSRLPTPGPGVPTPSESASTLFTGDELGSIKVWDLTGALLEKLGPAACSAKPVEDKATVPPASSGRSSHQLVYHRKGPLDGVGLQATVRFRELIEIAKLLRRGENLPGAQSEADGEGTFRRTGRLGDGTRPTAKNPRPVEAKPFPSSRSANSTAERSPRGHSAAAAAAEAAEAAAATRSTGGNIQDPSLTSRRKQECGSDQSGSGARATSFQAPLQTTADASRRIKNAGRPTVAKEHVEAVLNAGVDAIEPVTSWVGHKESITTMQVRTWLESPCSDPVL